MKVSRFDLEQELLSTWRVTDDINLLFEAVMEDPKFDRDGVSNALLGLKTMYDLRFEKLWRIFEGCVTNGELDHGNS